MLATLLKPTSGKVTWNGVDIYQKPGVLRQELGYVPQGIGYYPQLTAEDFCAISVN